DAGVPLVFWFWGGVDPKAYADAVANDTVDKDVPTNHSPFYAPVIHPTIEVGVNAMATAAREFLG
ncbi:MAG: amidohydrolase, partial [Actinomycetota bacterium]|nr:amidohydrolase [Actinomycetota bacterium]